MTDKTFNENILTANIPYNYGGNYMTTSFSFSDMTVSGVSSIVNLVALAGRTREEFLSNLSKIADLDIVNTIIDVFIDDCVSASNDDTIFTVEYEPAQEEDRRVLSPSVKEEYDSILNAVKERLSLDRFIKTNIHDLLLYGEFPYRKRVVDGKGVMEILEDLSVKNTIAIYEGSKLKEFYILGKDTPEKKSPDEVGHFILNPVKVRVEKEDNVAEFLPEKVLMGRSIISSAIEQLKRLRTNNIVDLVTDLKRILRPDFVQVQVPANMNPKDATDMTRKYERDFRSPVEALGKDVSNITVSDIVSLSAQIKVLPVWSDGKGTVSGVTDLGQSSTLADDADKRDRIKKDIALSVGVPPYYVTGDSTPDGDKVASLKLYSRYSKKCNSVQDCLKEGLRDLFESEFKAVKGFKISRSSIKITFKSVVNTDLLDNIEFVSGSTQVSNDILSLVGEVIQSGMGIVAKKEVLSEVLNKIMAPITVENLFEVQSTEEETSDDVDSDASDLDSEVSDFDKVSSQDSLEIEEPPSEEIPEEPELELPPQ